ncbi:MULTISPECIES: NgoMIV family type II restriction endonuclease [unclassified Pseudarthrobacter]|uniref:NgoMIV family type II restriction endonuclease n=1 Tax=unclassified Pseudarthrobacter TaxID=2647000 RepID=UPI003077C66D
MPAPFAAQLCGYRLDKQQNLTDRPNTSDASEEGSKELGRALFEELGVPTDRVGPKDPGARMEEAIQEHLKKIGSDVSIHRSKSALDFQQYAHLRVFPEFKKGHKDAWPAINDLLTIAQELPRSKATTSIRRKLKVASTNFSVQDSISERLKLYMPEESLLNLDLTCALEREGQEPVLRLGLSSKWTLRTDRAQDCVSQGAKLASQRRGPMPHYAVITMEPRPAMLKILADGSGAVDYVYHLDLPALSRAIEKVRSTKKGSWSPGITFDRLLMQGRIRDYDDLVRAVKSISAYVPPTVPEGAIAEAEEIARRSGETLDDVELPPRNV